MIISEFYTKVLQLYYTSSTVNSGKIIFRNFNEHFKALKFYMDKKTSKEPEQFLMLRENFRQLGEFESEDLCHFEYNQQLTNLECKKCIKFRRRFLGILSGYGTKPFRMFLAILLLITVNAAIFYFGNFKFKFTGSCKDIYIRNFLDYLYVSSITFFTVGYGDIVPANTVSKIFVIIESFLGVSAMSYFLVLLSRKIIR